MPHLHRLMSDPVPGTRLAPSCCTRMQDPRCGGSVSIV